jgi:hypothetical protein
MNNLVRASDSIERTVLGEMERNGVGAVGRVCEYIEGRPADRQFKIDYGTILYSHLDSHGQLPRE